MASLYSLIPNYNLLQSQYVGMFNNRYNQMLSTLSALHAMKWYTPGVTSKVLYLYNPSSLMVRYKAQIVPIGSHNPRSNIWTWAWSSKFNNKFYGLAGDAKSMNKLKKSMKSMAPGLVSADQIRLSLIDSAAIVKLIQAMSVSSLGGMTTLKLWYPLAGTNVYVVIKRSKQINQKMPKNILNSMHESGSKKKRRKSRKGSRKGSRKRRSKK